MNTGNEIMITSINVTFSSIQTKYIFICIYDHNNVTLKLLMKIYFKN